MSALKARQQRRRALAHQCLVCRRHWALHLVEHPAGAVIVCRHCGAVNRVVGAGASDWVGPRVVAEKRP